MLALSDIKGEVYEKFMPFAKFHSSRSFFQRLILQEII